MLLGSLLLPTVYLVVFFAGLLNEVLSGVGNILAVAHSLIIFFVSTARQMSGICGSKVRALYIVVLPRFGSEPMVNANWTWTGPKSGSVAVAFAEPNRRSGSRFRKFWDLLNRVERVRTRPNRWSGSQIICIFSIKNQFNQGLRHGAVDEGLRRSSTSEHSLLELDDVDDKGTVERRLPRSLDILFAATAHVQAPTRASASGRRSSSDVYVSQGHAAQRGFSP
ncbi:hypothetical protein DFH06DRAFT_1137459 [Mycena polygramma]|nr:hypothetical protein DFH06DRAFT_1137459 [Mycena polygramma]